MAPPRSELPDNALRIAETLLYVIVALLLVGGAAVVIIDTAYSFIDDVNDSVLTAATDLLAELLLVFVFVELLGATRATIRERRLVAEPFLLVGIIASIKEIVVIAGAERPQQREFAHFRDAMIEIGVLAGIVLVLAVAALLLRRREREPAETDA
jgi:uncharacterized membrane protein (DUF373 family)